MTKQYDVKTFAKIWSQYGSTDKVFFYSPVDDCYWFGAIRGEDKTAPFVFYPLPFFEINSQSTAADISKHGVMFKDCLVIKQGRILYDNTAAIDKQVEVSKKKHSFQIMHDDYRLWQSFFQNIMNELRTGEIEKVVASRCVEIQCETTINVESILLNLFENNKKSFIFAYQKNEEVFIGASPEILVHKNGSEITSYALAGTMAKSIHEEENAAIGERLLNDCKNTLEHNIVVEEILNSMKKATTKVKKGDTCLEELKNVFHLKTLITATDDKLDLLEWVKNLHPTPAMGGKPKGKAVEIIKKLETYDRGLFAAPLGIVERDGNGIFVVGIRSALIEGNKLFAYAGCGIVEQSDCREEYEEINNKLRTIIEAL